MSGSASGVGGCKTVGGCETGNAGEAGGSFGVDVSTGVEGSSGVNVAGVSDTDGVAGMDGSAGVLATAGGIPGSIVGAGCTSSAAGSGSAGKDGIEPGLSANWGSSWRLIIGAGGDAEIGAADSAGPGSGLVSISGNGAGVAGSGVAGSGSCSSVSGLASASLPASVNVEAGA